MSMQPPPPQTVVLTKAAYTVAETTNLLSTGRTKVYELIKNGHIKPTKLGRKTLILASEIQAFIGKLADGGVK